MAALAVVALACTGERGVQGEAGATGPAGPAGTTGAAGEGVTITALPVGDPDCPHGGTRFSNSTGTAFACAGEPVNGRMFGSGTVSLTVGAGSVVWELFPPTQPADFRFADLTVPAGTTLVVPSGTVLRCSGTFTNNGTIVVNTFTNAEYAPGTLDLGAQIPRTAPAHPGIGSHSASHGMYGPSTSSQFTAVPPSGVSAVAARAMIHLTPVGGGGGGRGSDQLGGDGGGTLTVLAKGAISLGAGAVIRANGAGLANLAGIGGGGGGVLVLASGTSVTNGGTIEALGGPGGRSSASQAAGGGGGGGIVHLIAPQVNQGTVNVTGGAAGVQTIAVTASSRGAGATGGASGGNGGEGADVSAGGGQGANSAGGNGHSLVTTVHPAELW